MRKWTAKDAVERVGRALQGSLDPDHITPEYLQSLSATVEHWLAIINKDLKRGDWE